MKGLRDELLNHIHVPDCLCGSMEVLNEHQEQEQKIQFLMGLNNLFTHIRGHKLLMDPMPPTNKVFALILQEE